MLAHAFEHRGCQRGGSRPSRAAIARIGATEEGVLRSHMGMRGGGFRDSVIFSHIAAEWPAAKAGAGGETGLPRGRGRLRVAPGARC